jgi:hypothetical protein
MATLCIVAPRRYPRCVIRPPPPAGRQRRSSVFPTSVGPPLQFQQVSPMFPVNSVTYLLGCSYDPVGEIVPVGGHTWSTGYATLVAQNG